MFQTVSHVHHACERISITKVTKKLKGGSFEQIKDRGKTQ